MALCHMLKDCMCSLVRIEHCTCRLLGCKPPKQYISSEVRKLKFWKMKVSKAAGLSGNWNQFSNPDSLNAAQ